MPNEAVSTQNAVWGGGGQQDAVCDPGRAGPGGAPAELREGVFCPTSSSQTVLRSRVRLEVHRVQSPTPVPSPLLPPQG